MIHLAHVLNEHATVGLDILSDLPSKIFMIFANLTLKAFVCNYLNNYCLGFNQLGEGSNCKLFSSLFLLFLMPPNILNDFFFCYPYHFKNGCIKY